MRLWGLIMFILFVFIVIDAKTGNQRNLAPGGNSANYGEELAKQELRDEALNQYYINSRPAKTPGGELARQELRDEALEKYYRNLPATKPEEKRTNEDVAHEAFEMYKKNRAQQ